MPERQLTAVAGQDVPGHAEYRPDRHQRHDQLVVAVGDERRYAEICDRYHAQRDEVLLQPRRRTVAHQARSAERPNKPCGRSNTINRNTTKIAAFCNCGGKTKAEHCCTKPTVRPPQNAPRMLPMPPSTTPEYMMMT